jgi:hypothetical protein
MLTGMQCWAAYHVLMQKAKSHYCDFILIVVDLYKLNVYYQRFIDLDNGGWHH